MNNDFDSDLEAPKQGKVVVSDDTTPKPDQWEDRNIKVVDSVPLPLDTPPQETAPAPVVPVQKLDDAFLVDDDEDPDLSLVSNDPTLMDPAMWDNDPIDVEVSDEQTDEDIEMLRENFGDEPVDGQS